MSEFKPTNKNNPNREYTAKQLLLLSLVWECDGDALEAARKAGYSQPNTAVDSLKEELVEMAKSAMARLSLKAVHNLERVLDSNAPLMNGSEKLKAAQMILDRELPKTEKIEVSAEKNSIFILPNKKSLDES